MCKIHDRIKCHSLFLNSTEQNAVLTCVLPSTSNVLLLFPAVKQLIDSKYFFCTRSVKFIPIDQACDGKDDCAGGEDEITCVSSFLVNTTFPGRPDSVPLCQHRHKSKACKKKKKNDSSFLPLCATPPSSASHVSSACPAGVQSWLRLAECVWWRLDPATHGDGLQTTGIHIVSSHQQRMNRLWCKFNDWAIWAEIKSCIISFLSRQ